YPRRPDASFPSSFSGGRIGRVGAGRGQSSVAWTAGERFRPRFCVHRPTPEEAVNDASQEPSSHNDSSAAPVPAAGEDRGPPPNQPATALLLKRAQPQRASLTLRLLRWLRRGPTLAGLIVLLVLTGVLAVVGAGMLRQLRQTQEERDQAQQRAQAAEELAR